MKIGNVKMYLILSEVLAWMCFHSVTVVRMPKNSMTTPKLMKQEASETTDVMMVARASA